MMHNRRGQETVHVRALSQYKIEYADDAVWQEVGGFFTERKGKIFFCNQSTKSESR